MEYRFTYRRDKRTRTLTWVISALVVALFVALALFTDGYLRAWTISILLAVVLLYVLSIPRYIKVTDEALEIHCVVEMTRIEIADVRSIRRLHSDETDRFVLLLGSYGFFGYFGYFADLRKWETAKVYAGEWNYLVEIEDIYEQLYIVSCRDAERLVETVVQAKLARIGRKHA